MLLLGASASDLIEIVTGSAGDIEIEVSWVDVNTAAPPVVQDVESDALASITTATTTTILTGAASTKRRVKMLSAYNNGASNLCTLRHNDATQTVELCEVTLLTGELLLWDGSRWIHYDVNLGQYPQVGAIATQAEMEAGTSLVTTVSPGRAHFHPGVCKFWVKTTPGNVNSASYNVTAVSDTAAGITVITIGTDFASASWCCQATIESTSDTMTVTNLKFCRIGLADQAAGSVSIECHDGTATTAVLEDPTAWHASGWGDHA